MPEVIVAIFNFIVAHYLCAHGRRGFWRGDLELAGVRVSRQTAA